MGSYISVLGITIEQHVFETKIAETEKIMFFLRKLDDQRLPQTHFEQFLRETSCMRGGAFFNCHFSPSKKQLVHV